MIALLLVTVVPFTHPLFLSISFSLFLYLPWRYGPFHSSVAVAVAFFLCWAPFHAQRLMAVYGKVFSPKSLVFMQTYTVLTYVSGVLYFMSTCINPLLYSIMSHKFRNAFKVIKFKCQLYLDLNEKPSLTHLCHNKRSFYVTHTRIQTVCVRLCTCVVSYSRPLYAK